MANACDCELEATRAEDEASRRTYLYLAEYWRELAHLSWQSVRRRTQTLWGPAH